MSWLVLKSRLVVRGAGGLVYSIVPFGEVKLMVDSTPGAEETVSCEGGSADAGGGSEDVANGEGALEVMTPMA